MIYIPNIYKIYSEHNEFYKSERKFIIDVSPNTSTAQVVAGNQDNGKITFNLKNDTQMLNLRDSWLELDYELINNDGAMTANDYLYT